MDEKEKTVEAVENGCIILCLVGAVALAVAIYLLHVNPIL